ncbi:MAG: hypothetical protein Q4P36_04245 [Bowdeniella nasicola]|nr:hypothetical protein [Bowdeniella nasicola]
MGRRIVSTALRVVGVRTEDDVRACLQALYDIFASIGLGQATFEVNEHGTDLFVKHDAEIEPNLPAIDAALRSAGPYHLDLAEEDQP